MKLNLGCGEYRQDGWVNIDAYPGAGPDVVADLASLPFEDGTAEAVYCGHCLEHNPVDDLPTILGEIRRVLAPGGRFCAVGPDLDRINQTERAVLYRMARDGDGGAGNPHGSHAWGCTETLLLEHVRQVFPDAAAVPIGSLQGDVWPVVSYADWQCAVVAAKPTGVVAKVVTPRAKAKPRTATVAAMKTRR